MIFLKRNDIVGRISYGCDIIFVIKEIVDDKAYLSGKYVRLFVDSPLSDLKLIEEGELLRFEEEEKEKSKAIIEGYKDKITHITGKILHLDSDDEYIKKCKDLYDNLGIYSKCIKLSESDFSLNILGLIKKYQPNIVVLTGHDSYNNKGLEQLANYKNSIHFMKAIVKIRQEYSLDDIFIFAGACGSNFEALIASGANFASSISRKNIEAYDPAIVAVLSAITPFNQIIDIKGIYRFSKLKEANIGGIESFGKMRLLLR